MVAWKVLPLDGMTSRPAWRPSERTGLLAVNMEKSSSKIGPTNRKDEKAEMPLSGQASVAEAHRLQIYLQVWIVVVARILV